jgi:hypothetical protein
MKTTDKKTERNFDLLISKLSENEVLNIQAMSHVRGGSADGEGNGHEIIISYPKL